MNYRELKEMTIFFQPALLVEGLIKSRTRAKLLDFLSILIALLFIPLASYYGAKFFPDFKVFFESYPAILFLLPKLAGIFYSTLIIWLLIFFTQAFFYSSYFRALDGILSEKGIDGAEPITFEAALAVQKAGKKDFTAGFLRSSAGRKLMLRLGVTFPEVKEFLDKRTDKIRPDQIFLDDIADEEYGVTFADLAIALAKSDKEFSNFLFSRQITDAEFKATARWLANEMRRNKVAERWWSKDNLGRVPGIGKDWAYGGAYVLDKYEKVSFDKNRLGITAGIKYLNEEVEKLERILTRTREANALVVGEAGAGALDVVYHLAHLIFEGRALPPLEDKRVVFLDTNKLVATTVEKSRFESEVIKVFEESIKAGNIILVFEDFPSFVESASALGSNAVSLIDSYLSSPSLQVVAVAAPDRFHRLLEPNTAIMSRFETILLKSGEESDYIRVVLTEVSRQESRFGILFTYQAVEEIVKSATRYFPDALMPDKAIDLLGEISSKAASVKLKLIKREDVLSLVESKTGIPVGEVKVGEREKLLNLEKVLHQRVIAQDEAVSSIAGALRRARSGVGNQNRPIGSFLFLGPTGVGKTETSKALAESFFGSEGRIIRFDMSEYRGVEALPKLIGSFKSGEPGILSSRLRESPYGVLLLDEFEKTSREAMDLFLQILDEGFFSDGLGKRVSARNLIIIATSNAGADLIWQMLNKTDTEAESGARAEKKLDKDVIINEIISRGIFKPELLNRFDGVILFHPIIGDNLRKVAKLQLTKLQKRLKEKGIDFFVDEHLIDFLVQFGSDPKFGARPMNRAIQDKVEQAVADKIIKGEIRPGQKVSLSPADLGGI